VRVKKVEDEHFECALNTSSTSKAPVLTAIYRESREVGYSVQNWLHEPHMTISRPRILTLQYFVVVTQLHTNCSSFYVHGEMEVRVKLVCSRDRTRTSYIWGLKLGSDKTSISLHT